MFGEKFKETVKETLIKGVKKEGKIFIADTTLRDGEQAPGFTMNTDEKLRMARQLDKLGVDSIEAGFAVSSKEDFDAIRLIAKEVKRPVISSLSRCRKEDIDSAREALKDARRWGIALFLGTSPMMREHSLGKTKEEIISIAKGSVAYARKFTDNVAFGAEDASRTEPEFLYRVYSEAIDAGAMVIGFPDTVGCLIPSEVEEWIQKIKQNVPGLEKVFLAAHFHNDLGLAVANALAAVRNGVNIIQCTVNGIGERAGNTSLEEFVMAVKTRPDQYKVKLDINARELYRTSRLLSEITGIGVAPNKPIVGENVFATEAGIHQAALLKNRITYEIIKPEDVGQKGTRFVLGRHSGKHAVLDRLNTLGIKLPGEGREKAEELIYARFKELAGTKKIIDDTDLEGLARRALDQQL